MTSMIHIKKKVHTSNYAHIAPVFETVIDLQDDPIAHAFFEKRGFSPDRPGKIERLSLFVLRNKLKKRAIKASGLSIYNHYSDPLDVYYRIEEALTRINKDDELYCFYSKIEPLKSASRKNIEYSS